MLVTANKGVLVMVYDEDMIRNVLKVIYHEVFENQGYIAHGLMYTNNGDLLYPQDEFSATFYRFWEENEYSAEPLTDGIIYMAIDGITRQTFIDLVSDSFGEWVDAQEAV